MPSRKQRRRRAKDRRHEYEYVYVDDDGREVDAEEAEPEAPKTSARERGASPSKRTNGRGGARTATSATGRKVEPPSWRRALKRALIFAPFMFITLYLLDRRLSVQARLLVTVEMLLFFVPFSYLVDRTMYRRLNRPSADAAPKTGRRPAKS